VLAVASARHQGKRLTEHRVSEIYASIGELRGHVDERLARLERIVSTIAELPTEMARVQAGALLGLLQRDLKKQPRPDEPKEP
jgi:hypothetical protein